MTDLVALERPADGVAVITMHNPELSNQGSWAAIDGLAARLKEAREGGARVAILTSDVQGHWLNHAYLRDLLNTFQGKPMTGSPTCWMTCMVEVTHEDLIVIAAINGTTSGGGGELAWACDLRVAEEGVQFAQIETQLGVAPGMGGSSRLAQIAGRGLAAEMALLGEQISAERLYQVGAINRLVPRGQALATATAWAERLAGFRPEALSAIKQQLAGFDNLPLTEALTKDQQLFQQTAFPPEGQKAIAAVQDRLEAGESMADIYVWKNMGV